MLDWVLTASSGFKAEADETRIQWEQDVRSTNIKAAGLKGTRAARKVFAATVLPQSLRVAIARATPSSAAALFDHEAVLEERTCTRRR